MAARFDSAGEYELLRASVKEPAAYEELYQRHAASMRRWLTGQLGDVSTANELLAETFAAGWLGRRRFSGSDDRAALGWLYGIELARNVQTGGAKLVGSKTVDGRRVIEFRATDGSWTYYADAHSYRPVRLDVRGIDAMVWPQGQPPDREQTTLSFNVRAYNQLPFRGNEKLLSLIAQHPGARIDTRAADYYATQVRLFPTG